MTKEQKKCIFNMDRKSMYFKINFTLIIMLIMTLSSCKDYETKDFYGEWYYKHTRFFFYENGIVEIHNLDTIFAYWDSHPSKFYKGTWKIQRLGKWDARIEINFDNWHTSTYIIENENELTDFIGDPDDYNRAVIRKKKE